ncbi:hypothetical protein CYLTODRAFT_350884 [Cylindrobasidium torrendii FP15055 ss-10]|uniref:t-SNARE coiled-coil homology domain-containing protein n=1 Tax=Cylindrobasidium torrendii FP15055 ss-10 TaxID=1314674 RepID=A0A0D7BDX7_9AGAR|nr:hypothetical protein CYLTODRAFT_350884 [Cylindrobasidium torrendii FP15055 ss-10]
MPLLRKNNSSKSVIPPVDSGNYSSSYSGGSGAPQPRSNAPRYTPSDRYQQSYTTSKLPPPQPEDDEQEELSGGLRNKYHRSNGVGDVYSRGEAKLDSDRNELFAGYNPSKSKAGSGRFVDGPEAQEGNDDDVENIKQQTRGLKQEGVNSTRNALRMALEAEDTARNTMLKIGDQSERLANTERHLDVSKGHSAKASDRTDELKQLNRSIFRPVITWNKDAKRRAQEQKVQDRYDEERNEREKTMLEVRETQNRLGRAGGYRGRGDDDDDNLLTGSGSRRGGQTAEAKKAQRSRFQFEATASDDEMEDELDGNLDQIGDVTNRLKALGMAMGQEIDAQNKRIDTISNKTDGMDQRLFDLNRRVRSHSPPTSSICSQSLQQKKFA